MPPLASRRLGKIGIDCSLLLTHLIRQKALGSKKPKRTRAEAKSVLIKILNLNSPTPSPMLKAFSVGWYSISNLANIFNPKTCNFDGIIQTKAICFTESPLIGLLAHRRVFGAKYGIAFDREWLFKHGANPCINIQDDVLKKDILFKGERFPRKVFNFLPPLLQPYVNVINRAFDSIHEREWRLCQDLNFSIRDIKFIFCPESDFQFFAKFQKSGKPILFDLNWLEKY